jgi:hypothetical protein
MVRASVRACRFGDYLHSTRLNVSSIIDITSSVQRHSQPEAELDTFDGHSAVRRNPSEVLPSEFGVRRNQGKSSENGLATSKDGEAQKQNDMVMHGDARMIENAQTRGHAGPRAAVC